MWIVRRAVPDFPRRIEAVPASRSMSGHRSARNSERRRPVVAAIRRDDDIRCEEGVP